MYAQSSLKTALLAGLVATASAFDCSGPYFSFYNRGGSSMSYQSLDPALNPGVKATHLHSFDGGNVISSSMGFADTQEATCTTNRIKPDKSLYWRPTLFWNGNNTGYYRVPDRFVKIYYKFGDSGNVKAAVSEFPEDFMMIAGQNNLRSDDGVIGTHNGPQLMWSCMGENYQRVDAVGFPKGFNSCKEGFAAQLTFPACWNGNPINAESPYDHMAYPNAGGKGIEACPKGFQEARFPTIFIEFWYDVSAFDGQYDADSIPWVLSNGDSTGYGFHADFLNGWEKGVLAKATADQGYCNCGCGCGNDEMKQCFGNENVNDEQDPGFKQCAATPQFPGEDGMHMDELPGCNPIQAGPTPATKVTGDSCGGGGALPAPSTSAAANSPATSIPAPIPAVVESDKEGDEEEISYSDEPTSIGESGPSRTTILLEAQPSAIAEDDQEEDHQDSPLTFQLPSSSAHVIVISLQPSPAPSPPAAGFHQSPPASGTSPLPSPNSVLSPEESGSCPTVTTITTKNIVTVTITSSQPTPTVAADEACEQPVTVFTTIKEVVTVTLAPDASHGKMKRHLEAHRHHAAGHGR